MSRPPPSQTHCVCYRPLCFTSVRRSGGSCSDGGSGGRGHAASRISWASIAFSRATEASAAAALAMSGSGSIVPEVLRQGGTPTVSLQAPRGAHRRETGSLRGIAHIL